MARDRQEGPRVPRTGNPQRRSLVDLEKIAQAREKEIDPKAWRFFVAARQTRIQKFITESEALVRRFGH